MFSFEYYEIFKNTFFEENVRTATSETNLCTKKSFFIKDFFSKYEPIRSFLRICLHLLNKFLMENIIFLRSG